MILKQDRLPVRASAFRALPACAPKPISDCVLPPAVAWAVPTVAAFLAPDVYIFTAGQALPWLAYVVVGGFAGVAAVVAVRAGRRRLVAAQAAGVAPSGLLH